MDRDGAGRFFVDLAFALVGRHRGGPAKAAIMASGFTGMISGSSIANTVTTGAFTIPMMKKMGFPATKAGAIEVAASTNGQIMPPIMGAAAFIMAEFIGISYYDVIVHAALPALLSYIALFYIAHLEAAKMGLAGAPADQLGRAGAVLAAGWRFLVPIVLLIYLLLVARWSPGSAVFYSILLLAAMMVADAVRARRAEGAGLAAGLYAGAEDVVAALISGAKSMAGVTAAVGAAGIIVGAVSSTGLNNAMLGVIEALSQGNFYALLLLTAVVCIVLGMGLPTTANYIVVASLMANVLVELGSASGVVAPLIAFHLFVFYYGLMADSTPPVCLAAFAASAISKANPLSTGVQAFLYDIRTAVLPLVFVFNPAMLFIGIESVAQGALVIAMCLIAILGFAAVTQGWLLTRMSWIERAALAVVVFALFRPDFFMNRIDPPFVETPLAEAAAPEATLPADRTVRLHVTRYTEYGERYRLYTLAPEEGAGGDVPAAERLGVAFGPIEDGRAEITDVAFMGPAEKAGAFFGDEVTAVDIAAPAPMAKEWIYLPALLALALILAGQRAKSARAGAATAAREAADVA
ncbi:MAG: TRAP transporter fused permease subunit, partial [Pseudomonadota bacterium]